MITGYPSQVIGVISFILFFMEYSRLFYNGGKAATVFKLLQVTGFFMFCGVAFYETFLWPVLAQNSPQILNVVNGPIYSSLLFIIPTGIAILAFMAGNIYLGIQWQKQNKSD